MVDKPGLVKVVGELYYRRESALSKKPIVDALLIGEDFQLYGHNDWRHTLKPFSQQAHSDRRKDYDDATISKLIYHGIIEFPDGTEKKEFQVWEEYNESRR